ncbi:glutamate formimidoyltransferase [Mangrovibacterium diazotrophicum]|uniref:Formimidoyltransferase-cyclodeaminase n=1 Tax=Mangrovibacterium diazotrophicum TaxID=1261403 RepID=A0A419W4X2_9BACT|nr:glutamate formimidoyltransferase [Mangrovibacterium diazotrophicum]RKD90502.1 glutamate formiminotransferase/formiminotetrahydrofolate cyclodeaminase [Mangrovibacterium diazotrophicum]
MSQLIECVPNFSEGRNPVVIKQITDAIESVENVKLLNVDPGKDTNRTVVTFVGSPEAVVEAAFRGVKRASEVIDMQKHKGEHPRFGATDVCPLVPVSNITMEETVEYARKLAKRIGDELGIHVYCYEFAAQNEERRSLANCRSGEYEGLPKKLQDPNWKPDFGPTAFNAKSGATAVSARNFLIAYNVNLNTTSTRRANSVAFDVREAGRVLREGDPVTGKVVKDKNGVAVRIPGKLRKVRAIGWFIKEYGVAQISMNLTDITITPIHKAFEAVCESAQDRGMRVTGSELIGLIPLNAMLEAGKYFLRKQQRSTGVSDEELINIAVKSMGLDELAPFNPKERIIEYQLRSDRSLLTDLSLEAFANETASESPAPGGGSVAAYVGSLGAALSGMVANLSSHKRGWDEHWKEFSDWAEKAKGFQNKLLELVDEDTDAFKRIMEAFKMPKGTDSEKVVRSEAIQTATLLAINVPLTLMETAYASMEVIQAMAEHGNPNSVSDVGVGALCARTAVQGAYLNVLINLGGLEDNVKSDELKHRAEGLLYRAEFKEQEILKLVYEKIG